MMVDAVSVDGAGFWALGPAELVPRDVRQHLAVAIAAELPQRL